MFSVNDTHFYRTRLDEVTFQFKEFRMHNNKVVEENKVLKYELQKTKEELQKNMKLFESLLVKINNDKNEEEENTNSPISNKEDKSKKNYNDSNINSNNKRRIHSSLTSVNNFNEYTLVNKLFNFKQLINNQKNELIQKDNIVSELRNKSTVQNSENLSHENMKIGVELLKVKEKNYNIRNYNSDLNKQVSNFLKEKKSMISMILKLKESLEEKEKEIEVLSKSKFSYAEAQKSYENKIELLNKNNRQYKLKVINLKSDLKNKESKEKNNKGNMHEMKYNHIIQDGGKTGENKSKLPTLHSSIKIQNKNIKEMNPGGISIDKKKKDLDDKDKDKEVGNYNDNDIHVPNTKKEKTLLESILEQQKPKSNNKNNVNADVNTRIAKLEKSPRTKTTINNATSSDSKINTNASTRLNKEKNNNNNVNSNIKSKSNFNQTTTGSTSNNINNNYRLKTISSNKSNKKSIKDNIKLISTNFNTTSHKFDNLIVSTSIDLTIINIDSKINNKVIFIHSLCDKFEFLKDNDYLNKKIISSFNSNNNKVLSEEFSLIKNIKYKIEDKNEKDSNEIEIDQDSMNMRDKSKISDNINNNSNRIQINSNINADDDTYKKDHSNIEDSSKLLNININSNKNILGNNTNMNDEVEDNASINEMFVIENNKSIIKEKSNISLASNISIAEIKEIKEIKENKEKNNRKERSSNIDKTIEDKQDDYGINQLINLESNSNMKSDVKLNEKEMHDSKVIIDNDDNCVNNSKSFNNVKIYKEHASQNNRRNNNIKEDEIELNKEAIDNDIENNILESFDKSLVNNQSHKKQENECSEIVVSNNKDIKNSKEDDIDLENSGNNIIERMSINNFEELSSINKDNLDKNNNKNNERIGSEFNSNHVEKSLISENTDNQDINRHDNSLKEQVIKQNSININDVDKDGCIDNSNKEKSKDNSDISLIKDKLFKEKENNHSASNINIEEDKTDKTNKENSFDKDKDMYKNKKLVNDFLDELLDTKNICAPDYNEIKKSNNNINNIHEIKCLKDYENKRNSKSLEKIIENQESQTKIKVDQSNYIDEEAIDNNDNNIDK